MEEIDLLEEQGYSFFIRFLVAVGIGFLVGMEREHVRQRENEDGQFAGVRTFTLIAICGFLAAFISAEFFPWAFVVALAGFIALVITAYTHMAKSGSIGGTSEISNILVFLLGAIVHEGNVLFAVVVAVSMVLLLSFKVSLHTFIVSWSCTNCARSSSSWLFLRWYCLFCLKRPMALTRFGI